MTVLAAPAAPAADPFGRTAPKLGVLLGLDADARVLLMGAAAERFDDFAAHFAHVDRGVPGCGTYDLVVWHAAAPDGARLARLRAALSPGGSLFLLASNPFALRRLLGKSRALRGSAGAWEWRMRLRSAGFARVSEFLPLPQLEGAAEFARSAGEVELPSYAPWAERALNRAGLLPHFHDGFAYIASGPRGGTAALLATLAARLGTDVELERFDLRDRGALVLLLRDAAGARSVCRVTAGAEVDRVVRRNEEWTRRIRERASIPAAVRELVPAPRGSFALGTSTAYVEECLDGVVAWKRAGIAAIEPTMFRAVYGFLRDFNAATAARVPVEDALLGELLDAHCPPWLPTAVAEPLQALRGLLAERVRGESRTLVWAHGDYGWGNAIVHPRTGELRGIIDWDQGRTDLAGVDLVNFLVQRDAGARAVPLPSALRTVAGQMAGGFMDYEERVPICARQRAELPAWVALRMAERAIAYPRLFARAPDEVAALLRLGCEALA